MKKTLAAECKKCYNQNIKKAGEFMYQRWQIKNILKSLETRRVVLIAGPRQCGKTTLAKTLIGPNVEYRTLDDVGMRMSAIEDPHGFVKSHSKTLIIDEVQRAPDLLLAIKKEVDEDTRPGRFLLTGSANLMTIPTVKESLAGRIATLRLRPLSRGEIENKTPDFFDRAFRMDFPKPEIKLDKEVMINMGLKGGFPEAIMLEDSERVIWHKDYIQTILNRDLYEIENIQRKDAMKNLVGILAAWSSKVLNISDIGSSLSVQRATLVSYMNALESLYIFEKLSPWNKTDYDRVAKHEKYFITDPGLMASLLNWKKNNIIFDGEKTGKLIETIVFNELSSQVEASRGRYTFCYYRDRQKREIDFLVENEEGNYLGIEVKSGSRISKNDFLPMEWFKNNLLKGKTFVGIVLYSGESPLSFGDRMYGIPFGSLF